MSIFNLQIVNICKALLLCYNIKCTVKNKDNLIFNRL